MSQAAMSSTTWTLEEQLAYARRQIEESVTVWARRHWANEVARLEAEVANA